MRAYSGESIRGTWRRVWVWGSACIELRKVICISKEGVGGELESCAYPLKGKIWDCQLQQRRRLFRNLRSMHEMCIKAKGG